jgi:hypothetical protein
MRTEPDLRRALASREHLTPDSDAVATAARRIAAQRPRRRRMVVVSGVVPATSTIITFEPGDGSITTDPTIDTGSALPGSTTDAHAGDRPDFFFTVSQGTVSVGSASYEIRPVRTGARSQTFTFVRAGGAQGPQLELTRPGSANDFVLPAGAPRLDPGTSANASVHGIPALFAANDARSWVRWQYAPGSYALLLSAYGGPVLSKAELLALAGTVRFVAPYPAKVPYRLDFAPADIPLENLAVGSNGLLSVAQFIKDSESVPRAYDITIATSLSDLLAFSPDYESWPWHSTTIAGHSGRCADLVDGRRCDFLLGQGVVSIGTGGLTTAEIGQLLGDLHLAADLGDQATWFDVDGAIPGV